MADSQQEVTYQEITTPELLMYRQIHPNWEVDSRITSQAFVPTTKDNNHLSVSRSDHASAQDSFDYHTKLLQLKSIGTWAVNVSEVNQLGLKCFDSPKTTPPPDPSHSHIDFSSLTNGQKKNLGDKLANFARTRGKLYP